MLVAVDIVLKAAVDRLIHAGIVVLRFEVLYAELPVVALERLSVDMDCHGRDYARVAEV